MRKQCKCGEVFTRVPYAANLSKDLGPGCEGFLWNCKCGSTLFMPAQLCQDTECIMAWVGDEPAYQKDVMGMKDYAICVECYCKLTDLGYVVRDRLLYSKTRMYGFMKAFG